MLWMQSPAQVLANARDLSLLFFSPLFLPKFQKQQKPEETIFLRTLAAVRPVAGGRRQYEGCVCVNKTEEDGFCRLISENLHVYPQAPVRAADGKR